ncbi:MAG TPA: iron-sulfur cluster assembly scaffold protein [Planctomycetota bacterium]|nr:iron-sulfur cluster assembly scaffold protein [Planctomycetota bacterium]
MAAPTRPFRDYFSSPVRVGALAGAQQTGEAENQVCGDWVRFHLRREGTRILEASVQIRGCSAVIACASLTAEALEGLEVEQARALDIASMATAAGARPRDLAHAPSVVARALESALASTGFDCQADTE